MSTGAISYDEVVARLKQAEDVIQALLSAQADAVVTRGGVQLLRLQETDRALRLAKESLEGLLEERTQDLLRVNQELIRENTERKRAEEALAASESKFRALLESASEAVLAVDSAGRIAFVNASAEKMFGFERRELAGKPLEALLPGIIDHMNEALRDLSPTQHPTKGSGLELAGNRKNGSQFPIEISLSFAVANGERLGLALVTDITERKRIEESLRQGQKLESMGLLAGGVAHDFNNLLTAILGNASLLAEEVPAGAAHHVNALISGAEKAAQITRQLLAYAGKGRFLITDLDLSSLVRENAALFRVSVPKGIEIKLNLKEDLPRIHADAGQIQQVLMNLVLNAAEAIGDAAPGTIGIGTGEEDIPENHSEAPAGRYVRIMVSDTGCGMSEATKAQIFDPFFTTKVYGRGLGLSAVLGILRSCAATIEIDSKPGSGTTFKLLFPAVEPDVASSDSAAEGIGARKSATILVVDDEDGVRAFAVAALSRAGYTVLQAAHGKEAVDLIASNRPVDLVLLDVTMPVMSGREALEEIRKLQPNLKVMVTSGYGSEEARRLIVSAGKEAGFLQKPYTAQRLLHFIDSAVQSSSDLSV